MLEPQSAPETSLELIAPDGARRRVRVSTFPFLIGRGTDTGNHLQLSDRRISRQCAALVFRDAQICIEDRGQRRGLFVNGERVENRALFDGDVVTFGLEDSFQLIFHGAAIEGSIPELFTRIEHVTATDSGAGGLRKLSLLLEATTLLHSQLPLHSILEHMVDQTYRSPTPTAACSCGKMKRASCTSAWPVKRARSGFLSKASNPARQRSGRRWKINRASSPKIWSTPTSI